MSPRLLIAFLLAALVHVGMAGLIRLAAPAVPEVIGGEPLPPEIEVTLIAEAPVAVPEPEPIPEPEPVLKPDPIPEPEPIVEPEPEPMVEPEPHPEPIPEKKEIPPPPPVQKTDPAPKPKPTMPRKADTPPRPAPKPLAAPAPSPRPGDTGPVCVSRSEPRYPSDLQRKRVGGVVVVAVSLDAKGRVASASVARSSGQAAFDSAAVAAVKRWRWKPAVRNGEKVASSTRVNVVFQPR